MGSITQLAGLNNLTFHNLRHEAISRKFESGMMIPAAMAISGHQTASQLFWYAQAKCGVNEYD